MNMDITFLTEEQIWGDKALQVMRDKGGYGTKTGMSDLAIVLGGLMGSSSKTSDGQKAGYLWSASSDGNDCVRAVLYDGDGDDNYPNERLAGARPALPSSVASSIKPSDVSAEALAKGEARPGKPIKDANGKVIWSDVVEFGEYPQTIAAEGINRELEQSFSRGQLKNTGIKYTFDGEKYDAYDKPFKAKEYVEYQHNGKRYIRVEAQPLTDNSVLSNGREPQAGEACWIEV
ncbi:MAG: hypothetical protein KGJ21_06700, partial [Pseudomonadota bacterium]|nr:hypothetical protein [Pseudomonadota bacterium]